MRVKSTIREVGLPNTASNRVMLVWDGYFSELWLLPRDFLGDRAAAGQYMAQRGEGEG